MITRYYPEDCSTQLKTMIDHIYDKYNGYVCQNSFGAYPAFRLNRLKSDSPNYETETKLQIATKVAVWDNSQFVVFGYKIVNDVDEIDTGMIELDNKFKIAYNDLKMRQMNSDFMEEN